MPRVNLKTGKIIQEENFVSGSPEKELQQYVEKHLNLFFQSHFLKNFYKIPGGEIDTLAITEDGKPCIIEYKHVSDDKIINQVVFYYDWLQERSTKYEFERLVSENKETEGLEVDFSEVRLITIAKKYSKWDISLIKHLDTDIECYTYTYHKDELDIHLDPIINQYKKALKTSNNSQEANKTFSLDDHRNRSDKSFQPIFDEFRRRVLELGENIEEGYVREYIKYVVNTTFLAVHIRKQSLILQLRVNEEEFSDPKGLAKDISKRKWSVTREIKVTPSSNLEYVIGLVEQAYNFQI